MDDKSITVKKRNWRWESTCSSFSRYLCKKCGYGQVLFHTIDTPWDKGGLEPIPAEAPLGIVPPLLTYATESGEILAADFVRMQLTTDQCEVPAYMHPPAKCHLSMLNNDVLYAVLSALPSESLLNFCSAYDRAHALAAETHILLLRELRCFFLRSPLVDCILGVGVYFDKETKFLSSDFDWLSEGAFNGFSVRKSIRKKPFDFFLPLAFSRAHFTRAEASIWNRLIILDDAIQKTSSRSRFNTRTPRVHPRQSIRVLYQFMNNVVVSLMRSADTIIGRTLEDADETPSLIMASERAVVSYCQLYHLLTSLAAHRPDILGHATSKIRRFLAEANFRTKASVPDMGEFIVMASLVLGSVPEKGSERITWSRHLNGPLLEEAFTRNVRWALKANPELEVLEEGASEYRLEKTFEAGKTALRLVVVLYLSAGNVINRFMLP